MKIVVAGCGKIGTSIIEYLYREGHSVTVIDIDAEAVNTIMNYYDIGGIVGNSSYPSVLRDANISRCSIFIALTGNDELNLISCKIAKSLGANKVIARVKDTEYTDNSDFLKNCFDIDTIINTELTAAKEIFGLLRFPFAKKVSSFEKGKAYSVEIYIPTDSMIVGKSIKDLSSYFEFKFVIIGILRDNELIIPNGDTIIYSGDIINLMSTPRNIDEFLKRTGIENKKIKSLFIVGGSRISFHLARLLHEDKIDIKIIEKNELRCNQLIEGLDDKVDVVMADGTNEEILDEEGISSYDACLSLTNHDEENILVSLYAKTHNIETIITKINNDRLNDILNELNLKTKVSPNKLTINHILYFTRAMKAKEENTIERIRKSMNNKMEILEFNVNNNEEFTNKYIRDLSIRRNILLACIIRKGRIIVPKGDTIIEGDDKIIITTNTSIKSLERILR